MHIYLNIRIQPAQSVKVCFQADHTVVNKQLACSSGETIASTLSVIHLPVALWVGLKPHKRSPLHWHSHCDFNIGFKKAVLIHESSLKITGKNDTSFPFAFRDEVKMLVNKIIYFVCSKKELWKGKWNRITHVIIIIMLNDLQVGSWP